MSEKLFIFILLIVLIIFYFFINLNNKKLENFIDDMKYIDIQNIYEENIKEKINKLNESLDKFSYNLLSPESNKELDENQKLEKQNIYSELNNLIYKYNKYSKEEAIQFYKEYYKKKFFELQDKFSSTTDEYYKSQLNNEMNIILRKLNDI
jgi:hypothetical protein